MKTRIFACMLTALAMTLAWQNASGQHFHKHHQGKPDCEPGYQIVEEVVMQDVERLVCKMVPEMKKKWVYDWVDDPFCILDAKHGQCPQCTGAYCRKHLVKKQVDDPCNTTMKCVMEKIVERVPVTVYRKVPIGAPKIENIPAQPKPLPK